MDGTSNTSQVTCKGDVEPTTWGYIQEVYSFVIYSSTPNLVIQKFIEKQRIVLTLSTS